MFDIHSIEFDYKFPAGIGVLACVLSILIGLISGVNISTVIIRSLIITPVFFGIGYAVVSVLRKFVPEIYEALNVKNRTGDDFKIEEKGGDFAFNDHAPQKTADEMPDVSQAEKHNRTSSDKDFSEIRDDSYPKYEHSTESDVQANSKGKSGKMGKHILKREELAQYEPKLMAEAVRTMMQKDDEK